MGYSNPRLVELLEERKETVDAEDVNQIFRLLQPMFARDLPLTFLFHKIQTYAVHKRIKGLFNISRADPARNMEHLWIEEEK